MSTHAENLPVPSSYTRIIARELALQERDLSILLLGTGLTSNDLLTSADSHVTAEQTMQILHNAQQNFDAPDFGLRLGRQLQPSSHGPMGYLVLSSPDVLTGFDSFAEFLPTRLPFSSVDITLDEQWLTCFLNIKVDVEPALQRLLQECFALMIQSVAESILGQEMRDAVINLPHSKPTYHKTYNDYFHSPVSFDQDTSIVRIPASVARLPNVNGNTQAYALTQKLCLTLLDQIPETGLSSADRVRRLLLLAPIGSQNAESIAQAMFITKRTLQRRLDRENTSYREITEKLHAELARKHLLEKDQTIESIAALMGYCDTPAFRKAFRRWYGQSPNEYRKKTIN